MILINEYYFDSEKLLLIPKKLIDLNIYDKSKYPNKNNFYKTNEYFKKFNENKIKYRLSPIDEIGIAISDGCNLRCNYCIDAATVCHDYKISTIAIENFTLEMIKRWSIGAISCGEPKKLKVYFTGAGEQTLRWSYFCDSVNIIERTLKDNNIPYSFSLTTNGLLSKKQVDFISHKFKYITVSYDGLPDIQNNNRRTINNNATSNMVIENIKAFIDSNMDVTVRTTIWHNQFDMLKDMLDYLFITLGSSFFWEIKPVLPYGRALDFIFKNSIKMESFLPYYVDLLKYAENRYKFYNISDLIYPKTVNEFCCGALTPLTRMLWLNANGTIKTCIESSSIETIVGEIVQDRVTWKEFYEDPIMKYSKIGWKKCSDCIAFPFCRGGCPIKQASNVHAQQSFFDWECEEIKLYVQFLLRSLTEKKKFLKWGFNLYDNGIIEIVEQKQNEV